MKVVY